MHQVHKLLRYYYQCNCIGGSQATRVGSACSNTLVHMYMHQVHKLLRYYYQCNCIGGSQATRVGSACSNTLVRVLVLLECSGLWKGMVGDGRTETWGHRVEYSVAITLHRSERRGVYDGKGGIFLLFLFFIWAQGIVELSDILLNPPVEVVNGERRQVLAEAGYWRRQEMVNGARKEVVNSARQLGSVQLNTLKTFSEMNTMIGHMYTPQ